MCLLTIVLLNRCVNVSMDKASFEHNDRFYSLLDYKGTMHKYKVDLKSLSFPQDNRELTQYCGIHFHWEDIKAVYGKVGKDLEWRYYVYKNKKSFKMKKI